MAVTRVLRTTVDDDLFIRMDAALGVPVVNQMVWRLRELPSPDELDRFAERLTRGRLARLLRRSRVPLVRDHWVPGGAATGGVHVDASPIPAGEVVGWIDAAAARPFDLTRGPVWEVRAAPIAGAGALVSVCLSHAVGDGAAAVTAFTEALTDDDHSFTAATPSPVDQAREALGRSVTIAGSAAAIVRDRVSGGSAPAATGAVTAASSRALPAEAPERGPTLAPFSVVSVDTDDWDRVAAQGGGSSNALFIAVVVGLVVAAGRADRDDIVRVSVPMSTREPDDVRANATVGLSLDVPAAAALDGDLATIRRLAKEVYTARTSRPTTFVRLQPVMQALGDRAVAALSRGATTPLALASSLGRVDPTVAGLGDPARANGVVTRSTTQSITTARLRSLRGGLAAWVNDAAGTTTLSVVGLDPDGLGPDRLDAAVLAELRRRDLEGRPW
ncbi:hypothetical protein [uncultured Williamsia sp.]|uniref:hypothetical protein n=1 Tax=uncultured Williamsia sp. TaxID=259311 RepID=UPI00262608C9|nr:hypothetical protein [uncultured Williamsia sp.]